MAITLSSIISSTPLRRRLPLVGALCMLSLGLSNLCPSFSLSSKLGCSRSLLLRSNFGSGASSTSIRTIKMEANNRTVPSIVVYVTVPNKEAGKKLAESIVKEKLAACVNRVPGVESVYQWQGQIQTDSEELLIIKTRESLLDSLTEHVQANHEYEKLSMEEEKKMNMAKVPEVIALPITGGSVPYLEWIKNSTKD